MSIYRKILGLATSFDKLAAEVADLSAFKQKKQRAADDKKGVVWLFEQMDPQIVGDAFSSGGLTVDDMHQARKAIGFPPVDKDAPPWVRVTLDIIDDENAQRRRAEYARYVHSISLIEARREGKEKEVRAEINKEKEEQEQQFKEDVKRGWIRFAEFNKWKDNYPLLFEQFGMGVDRFIESLKRHAAEQIKNRNEYIASKTVLDNAFRGDPAQLPEGTTLYTVEEFMQEFGGEWMQKNGKSEWDEGSDWQVHWPNGSETVGSDDFVRRALSDSQELYPTLITVPLSYINEIKNSPPTEQQTQHIIQYKSATQIGFCQAWWRTIRHTTCLEKTKT